MNYTQNYHLPQWVETDRILRTDFNDMASAIDAALGDHGETLAEHAAAHAGFGNCQLYTTTYVGTDTTQPLTFTFPGKVMFFAIMEQQVGGRYSIACRGVQWVPCYPSSPTRLDLTWGENQITWTTESTAADNYNLSASTYCLVALLEKDA